MRFSPYSGWSDEMRRMNSMCLLGMAGLPILLCDFLHQNSRNFRFLYRITVSGLTRISSDRHSFQTLETTDQNSRFRLFNLGFLALRL